MKIIEVKGVWKKFKLKLEGDTLKENLINFLQGNVREREIWALKNVTFSLEEGECLGIMGENGSGKTTLLKVIAGILDPTKGEVKVRGKIAPILSLGVGFENELTARENIFIYASVMGLKKREIEEKYKDILKFAGLEDYEEVKLKYFSNGMKLRLGFAILSFIR